MKSIFLSFLCLIALHANANAQVKFEPVNAKNKTVNIVYIGIANTFAIKTPQEVSIKSISTSTGNIRMNDDNTFSLYVHDVSEFPVELEYTSVKNGEETQEKYPVKFIIKKVPEIFQLKVGEYTKSGKVSLEKLRKNNEPVLNDDDFNGTLPNHVIVFDITYVPVKGNQTVYNYKSDSRDAQEYYKALIGKLKTGEKILIERATVTTEDGMTREMNSLEFQIVK